MYFSDEIMQQTGNFKGRSSADVEKQLYSKAKTQVCLLFVLLHMSEIIAPYL